MDRSRTVQSGTLFCRRSWPIGLAPTRSWRDEFLRVKTDPDQYRAFEGIKLKVKPGPHERRGYTYNKPVSGDAEICVTIQLPHLVTDTTGTGAGVLFGGDDAGDFDFFFLWANGNA